MHFVFGHYRSHLRLRGTRRHRKQSARHHLADLDIGQFIE
jgi:hypothetical protein